MPVTDADPTAVEPELRTLFREYHDWMKSQVIEEFGGVHLPRDRIESDYDITAQIEDDIAYLTDPDTDGRVFTAHHDDDMVGCVVLRWRDPDVAEVKRLYVRPDARGQGLGRALMDALIESAREMGCRRLLLHTGTFNDGALALYRDLGFRETAAFEAEPPEAVHEDWVFMERTLDAE